MVRCYRYIHSSRFKRNGVFLRLETVPPFFGQCPVGSWGPERYSLLESGLEDGCTMQVVGDKTGSTPSPTRLSRRDRPSESQHNW